MRSGSLLLINLLNSDAFGRLHGRFALEIAREKQPREIKGPSHAKGADNDAKWTPRGASGSTLGPENVTNMYKRCYFACVFSVSISEGLLGRIFSETASEWHGRNCVWIPQARADRIFVVCGKTRTRGSFLYDFDVVSGAWRSHLADFLHKKW